MQWKTLARMAVVTALFGTCAAVSSAQPANVRKDLRASDPQKVASALRALSAGPDRATDAVPEAIRLMRQPTAGSFEVRRAAVECLIAFQPESLPALVKELKEGEDESAVWAADCLARIGAPSEPVVRPLLSSTSATTRFRAAEVVGALGAAAAPSVQSLRPLIADRDRDVSDAAIAALGQIGEPAAAAIPDLEQAVDGRPGAWAIAALVQIGPPAEDAVKRILAGRPGLLPKTLQAIGETKRPGRATIDQAASFLGHESWEVRDAAVAAIGRMADRTRPDSREHASRKLMPLLKDSDPRVRSQTAWALGRFGPFAAMAAGDLVTALDDPTMRTNAAGALAGIGAPADAAGTLVEILNNGEDALARYYAAGALGTLKGASPDVVAALQAAVRAGDPSLRKSAIQSLGRIGKAAASAIPDVEAAATEPSLRKDAEEAIRLMKSGS